jgi:hypothetical protein
MKTINDVLNDNSPGLYYGNRILLPFQAEILKIVIDSQIIANFSKQPHGASVRVTDDYTEIYLCDYKDLEEELTKYDLIKIVLVQQGKDIFNFENHIPLELSIESNHKLSIKKIGTDEIFFE